MQGSGPSPGWRQRCLCCPRPEHHLPQGSRGQKPEAPGPFHALSACPSASGRPRSSVLLSTCPPQGPPSQPRALPRPQPSGATQVEVGAARGPPGGRRVDGHCRGVSHPSPSLKLTLQTQTPQGCCREPQCLSSFALCTLGPTLPRAGARQYRRQASAVPGVGSGWSSRKVPLSERTAGGGWEPLRGA